MAKHDWEQLQQEFLDDHEKTNVGVKGWCESKGLTYSSARRYIKAGKSKAKVKISNKVRQSKPKLSKEISTRTNAGTIKHGGYSKYFARNITDLVEGTELRDELELCRSRIHLVVCTIEEIQRRLEENQKAEVAASLYDSLFKADTALDRNIARVESITKTLSSIRIDDLNQHKITADTARSLEITKATVINAKKAIVQTELAQLAAEKARKELGGTSKIDEYIDGLTGDSVDAVIG